MDQTRRNAAEFVWTTIRSVEEQRCRTCRSPAPHATWRSARIFCFCTPSSWVRRFHHSAIREMCRVPDEVRFLLEDSFPYFAAARQAAYAGGIWAAVAGSPGSVGGNSANSVMIALLAYDALCTWVDSALISWVVAVATMRFQGV